MELQSQDNLSLASTETPPPLYLPSHHPSHHHLGMQRVGQSPGHKQGKWFTSFCCLSLSFSLPLCSLNVATLALSLCFTLRVRLMRVGNKSLRFTNNNVDIQPTSTVKHTQLSLLTHQSNPGYSCSCFPCCCLFLVLKWEMVRATFPQFTRKPYKLAKQSIKWSRKTACSNWIVIYYLS